MISVTVELTTKLFMYTYINYKILINEVTIILLIINEVNETCGMFD